MVYLPQQLETLDDFHHFHRILLSDPDQLDSRSQTCEEDSPGLRSSIGRHRAEHFSEDSLPCSGSVHCHWYADRSWCGMDVPGFSGDAAGEHLRSGVSDNSCVHSGPDGHRNRRDDQHRDSRRSAGSRFPVYRKQEIRLAAAGQVIQVKSDRGKRHKG